jgi:hypothetical protein
VQFLQFLSPFDKSKLDLPVTRELYLVYLVSLYMRSVYNF